MFRPTDGVPLIKVDGDAGPHSGVRLGSGSPSRTDMGDNDRCTSPTRLRGVFEYLGEEFWGNQACEGHCGVAPADGERVGVRLGT